MANYVPGTGILPTSPSFPGTITASTYSNPWNTIPSGTIIGGIAGQQTTYNNVPLVSTGSTHIIKLFDTNNNEVVRMDPDGTIVWASGYNIDDAAHAFERVLHLSAEHKAGITTGTINRLRDKVFEELISIANDKGSLSAADLIYLLQAAKMVDKLKGDL